MRHASRAGPDAAVSSVVGTVLMLGITIAVFAGFSVVVIDRMADDSADQVRTLLDAETQEGRLLLRHTGGEPLSLDDGTLLLVVDGADVERPLSDVADQVADGAMWRIGESLCLAGPQPPCLYGTGQVSDVRVVAANQLAFPGLLDGVVAVPVTTFVATATATTGSVAAFGAAQSALDGGAEATFTEGAATVPPGSGGPTKLGGASVAHSGAVSPSNALSTTDSNAEALLDASGEFLEVSGFTLPAQAAGISGVTIGFEGRRASNGGSSDPAVLLSYKVAGVTGASTLSSSLTSTAQDQHFTRAVTADRAWTVADVQALTARVALTNTPSRDAAFDHLYVTVAYTTAGSTTYSLDVRADFAAVPAATTHTLEVGYRVAGDTFLVQVWDGAAYTTRGDVLSATAATEWTYVLTAAEYNGGAPRLRFMDATPAGTTQGALSLDYIRVVGME